MRARDAREELAREVGRRAVLAVGAPVARCEEVPVGARSPRGPVTRTSSTPASATRLPLLADLLALVVRERGEEVVEVAVAGVAPMELHAGALEQPHAAQRLRVRARRGRARAATTRPLARELHQRACASIARAAGVAREQPRARRGRERHRAPAAWGSSRCRGARRHRPSPSRTRTRRRSAPSGRAGTAATSVAALPERGIAATSRSRSTRSRCVQRVEEAHGTSVGLPRASASHCAESTPASESRMRSWPWVVCIGAL